MYTCIHIYMRTHIHVFQYVVHKLFTNCSQIVHKLFTNCSYGVHIYMLYCIMEGGKCAQFPQWNLVPLSTSKNFYMKGGKNFMSDEKNYEKEHEEELEKIFKLLVDHDAEKIVTALFALEVFDALPPVKSTVGPDFEKLIRRMVDHPGMSYGILKRAIEILDSAIKNPSPDPGGGTRFHRLNEDSIL